MHRVLGEIGTPIGVLFEIPIDLTDGCQQVKTDREEKQAKTNSSGQ
jgi:hypothetical protein